MLCAYAHPTWAVVLFPSLQALTAATDGSTLRTRICFVLQTFLQGRFSRSSAKTHYFHGRNPARTGWTPCREGGPYETNEHRVGITTAYVKGPISTFKEDDGDTHLYSAAINTSLTYTYLPNTKNGKVISSYFGAQALLSLMNIPFDYSEDGDSYLFHDPCLQIEARAGAVLGWRPFANRVLSFESSFGFGLMTYTLKSNPSSSTFHFHSSVYGGLSAVIRISDFAIALGCGLELAHKGFASIDAGGRAHFDLFLAYLYANLLWHFR